MGNFDPINPTSFNYNNPVQNNGWGQPHPYTYTGYMPQTQSQTRLNTNAIFVTSLEEALIKTTERNSDIIYFHQDKNEFYRIKVDMEGRKSWAVFMYNLPSQEDNAPATKADIATLLVRIEALENLNTKEPKVAQRKKKEVSEVAESDG